MPIHPLPWSDDRPRILVIACSDGRLERQTDDFLKEELGVTNYDRYYVPGGPGALVASDFDYPRVDAHRKECHFLIRAHEIREVILLFHGNSADGPEGAMCADYVRKLPGRTNAQLRAQQEADLPELLNLVFSWPQELKVRAYRAEVGPERRVDFVPLTRQ